MDILQLITLQDQLLLERCSLEHELRDILARKGVERETIVRLIAELCREMCVAQYSLQQKQAAINLTLTFLKELPSYHSKEAFSRKVVQ